MTSSEVRDRLAEPFDQKWLRWKPQSVRGNRALAVAYISGNAVMERLDDVVGPGGWKTKYLQVGPQSVECRLYLKVDGEWVCKADVGATSVQPDEGDRMKAAYSDALKRAALNWGIGRYIRSLPQDWCDYDHQKKQIINPPRLPAWALPKGANGVNHQQSQPQPQRQPAPQQQSPPQSRQQVQPQGGPASEAELMLKLVAECRTAAELEANCMVADVKVKQGVLGGADLNLVQEAWVERAVLVLEYCKTQKGLDNDSALFARCFRDACRLSDQQYKRIADKVAAKYAAFAPSPGAPGDGQPW